ncbi:ribonuclease toxin immunity protein CdiI [Burkholderia ubonensis]|uniref:ribonuclease toxin immunity protein CdiI n=1 Tax=Burkholderia ubonensis TaxID=101571 RepID=UPI0012F92AF4|nr:ribonuclease toxin immunity protein CdiI [Burkholderia ubonensis]
MSTQLFRSSMSDDGIHATIKDFFNAIYLQDRFLWALPLLLGRRGCAVNNVYCLFPDSSDPASNFDGVIFGVGSGEIVATEKLFLAYINDACCSYLALHPQDKSKIDEILGGLPPKFRISLSHAEG